MELVERGVVFFADTAWSYLLYLLIGGGLFLLLYSRFMPLRHFRHSVEIIRGKYDDPNEPGDITHFQALVSALAATIGMGNISGVAVAIAVGGPGAMFWMWVSALVGIATKFFTCSLAIMYRGTDSAGKTQGGPMYVVQEGLGPSWKPLAFFFAVVAVIGCLPLFQVNQLVQIMRDVIFVPMGVVGEDHFWFDLTAGVVLVLLVGTVIFGGITRIADVASRVVPAMVILYMFCALWIIATNFVDIPRYLMLILTDAFSGEAAAGGAVGAVIVTGVRRAAFSNEAGIGTESLVHGATKTREPTREGLVAMLEPVIDTMIVCTCTALVIMMTGVWQTTSDNGVTLTANAFESAMPGFGSYMLIVCVLFFSTSTIFTYSYYGTKCLGFLIGARWQFLYNYFYVGCIIAASVASLDTAISMIDGTFALMAIPTMLSALLLSPKVMAAMRDYRKRFQLG
ncbi:MAG: alanine:cation symporter family protein [Gemmatimonadetes bacterium]|nr:alanine:cation symporter family protein [Gemmatimonadota bacterium]MYA77502.1 alanine:cation symporter family protein [Gemmatimonadota bacterium]MYG17199.1 alanine:cation symporter family protein [Gemmatimonadota bacterium]MYH19074.1 alanine:cation symporter family protein [Gemmatimonadota bacterium]MYK97726.1 alanine:cation symporter family protein [Gemmatimonadota bacterium]